ncbi:MAG: hypothetical protein GWO27_08195 [Thermoplasmata archaeon]|nr:hypothetical protein [Thermoplasmata archaeon]
MIVIVAILAFAIMSTSNVINPQSTIRIENVGEFEIDPSGIERQRADVFAHGQISIFDVLVDLDRRGEISMTYHYDEELETHVIDSLNGKKHWWYQAYYDGGWLENNNWRIDLFPYKDKMYIQVFHTNSGHIEALHDSFRTQVERRDANGGTVMVETVRIRAPGINHVFHDVHVTPHDLRDDALKEGTVTAIDVIMSLGDQGRITYETTWYEEIAGSEVKTYFVTSIDGQAAHGRCGYVYEVGEENMYANHIHIPMDMRVLTSPEYFEMFWICL